MVNDLSIAVIILGIFIATAILITPIAGAFDVNIDELDSDNYISNIKDETRSVGIINTLTVMINVGKLATFDFGNTLNLPFWLDAFYTFLAIIFLIFVIRTIRGN